MEADGDALPDDLPGADLVAAGIADLRARRESPEAALVQMASPRLRSIGIAVPPGDAEEPSEHRLYRLLADEDRANAHSRYNALVGRIVSFARAAEARHSAARQR